MRLTVEQVSSGRSGESSLARDSPRKSSEARPARAWAARLTRLWRVCLFPSALVVVYRLRLPELSAELSAKEQEGGQAI